MQLKSAFLSLFAVAFTAVNGQSAPNLTSILSSTPELSALTELVLDQPELLDTLLNWPTNLTIVAPSNEAFDEFKKLNLTSLDSVPLIGNKVDVIVALLSYHVLNGTFLSTVFVEGDTAAADTLLMNNSYANLANDAPQVLLGRNHDGTVTLYSGLGTPSRVEKADIEFNKGVIHIIDHVLTLPNSVSRTAAHFNLTALSGALVKTGLLETVDTTPSLTIFAPNNAAFQLIGNLAAGLSTEQLADILKYHVVNTTIYDISGAQSEDIRVASLQGGELTINENEGGWFVNGARIIGGKEGGVVVANGIVYVIDGVLNPAQGEVTTTYTPNPTVSTQPPAFSSASYVTEVPFTTELVSGTPTSSGTVTPTSTNTESGSTTLKVMPVSFAGLIVALFMAGLGGFFMV